MNRQERQNTYRALDLIRDEYRARNLAEFLHALDQLAATHPELAASLRDCATQKEFWT